MWEGPERIKNKKLVGKLVGSCSSVQNPLRGSSSLRSRAPIFVDLTEIYHGTIETLEFLARYRFVSLLRRCCGGPRCWKQTVTALRWQCLHPTHPSHHLLFSHTSKCLGKLMLTTSSPLATLIRLLWLATTGTLLHQLEFARKIRHNSDLCESLKIPSISPTWHCLVAQLSHLFLDTHLMVGFFWFPAAPSGPPLLVCK